MVLMAVRLGMRASDICSIEFQNFHWDRNTIEFVTEKTGRATVFPLTADVGKPTHLQEKCAENVDFIRELLTW